MKLKFLVAALLTATITIAGCKDPEVVTPGPKKTDPKADPKPAVGMVHASISSEFPEAFDGNFNPDGLDVGGAVGQLAPEIEGEDLDGAKFKLSDYRGKVVMLDFYGDW